MKQRSVMVGLLCAALGAAGPAIAERRDCPPGAVVEGDPAEAEPVRQHLASAGLMAAAANCPAVRARVTRQGDALTVVLLDPDGRSAGRRLADARIAAAWIESWMSTDLGAPLLAPRPAMARPVAIDVSRPAPPAEAPSRFALGVGSRSLYAGDGSSWRSLDVSGCVRVGFACVGAAASVADNRGFSANDGLTEARRRTVDLMAIARVPIRLGRATLSPGLAIGGGWMDTARDQGDGPQLDDDPTCSDMDPNTGMCPPVEVAPYYIDDDFTASTTGLRGQASLSLSVPIAGPIALEIAAGIDVAPFAHGRPFSVAQPGPDGTDPGNGGDPADPDLPPPSDPFTDLPGEPGHYEWWGISVRVEGG